MVPLAFKSGLISSKTKSLWAHGWIERLDAERIARGVNRRLQCRSRRRTSRQAVLIPS